MIQTRKKSLASIDDAILFEIRREERKTRFYVVGTGVALACLNVIAFILQR